MDRTGSNTSRGLEQASSYEDQDHDGRAAPRTKRRRRIFSCESCQRLKCRCDFDPILQSCRRCQNLRIKCSRRHETDHAESTTGLSSSSKSIEERLRRNEEALEEIKALLRQRPIPPTAATPPSHAPGKNHDRMVAPMSEDAPPSASNIVNQESGPEHISDPDPDPADHAVKSAPIVVLREIGRRYFNGSKKPRGLASTHLVDTGLLDEEIARDLIHLFFQYKGHYLPFRELRDLGLASSEDLGKASPFLHSVCCLHGLVYRPDIFGTRLHRNVNEQVRAALGQTLLISPLALEDILGVLLMSDNAMSGIGDGTEYIDSWMLTGYCAKQAMLSISFSEIVRNIGRENPTPEDRRAIQLWSTICLQHLHWSATTGRPSVIPNAYLTHCDILLSFYDASILDGMLIAEVGLYKALLQKLDDPTHPRIDDDESIGFTLWKQQWNHLLSLSTASMLKTGYHAACLTLVIRSLQDSGEDLESTVFLTSDSSFDGVVPVPSDPDQPRLAKSRDDDNGNGILRANLRVQASQHSVSILETFLSMPSSMMDSVLSNRCLCLGYSALVVAHYGEAQSRISDEHKLDVLTRLDEWLSKAPGKGWAVKFGRLAKQKLLARLGGGRREHREAAVVGLSTQQQQTSGEMWGTMNRGGASARLLMDTQQDSPGHGNTGSRQYPKETVTVLGDESDLRPGTATVTGEAISAWSGTVPPMYELQEDLFFPNIEDFFGGGFLDFCK